MYYEKTQKERIQELEEKVLLEIKKYISKHGYSPSVRDLKRLAGIPSTSTTFQYMKRLQLKGLIDWDPYKVRSLKVLKS
ncbi:heme-binding protein [Peribacillus muralis]|uniref:LexA family protein n=1 Tax=Peribacillus muralis TaxID=264697 RepID=UPI003D01FA10